MRPVWCLVVMTLLAAPGLGCRGPNQELTSVVRLGEPTVAWSSLGMAGIEFSLTNRTDQDVALTAIRLLVEERIPEAEKNDTEACLGTKLELGDLYFNIARDSLDPGLKEFSPEGGIAPVAALTIPAGARRVIDAMVFNHLAGAEGEREVDACRVRVQIELDGATSSSRAIELHFNEREQ